MKSATVHLLLISFSYAIIPTAIIHRNEDQRLIFCAPSITAGWGGRISKSLDEAATMIIHNRKDDPTGCSSLLSNNTINDDKFIFIVRRGNCTFLEKAKFAQESGATALIVRNTRQAVYELDIMGTLKKNNTHQIMKHAPYAYDCTKGESYLTELKSPVWETDDVRCSRNRSCASSSCIPTGLLDSEKGGHQLCCLWDTYTLLGANITNARSINISVVMVTIAEGNVLAQDEHQQVKIYMRHRPVIEPSSFLIWLLGVVTVIISAYSSAEKDSNHVVNSLESKGCDYELNQEDAHVNIDMKHALGFVFIAASFLILLYYIQAAALLVWIYAFASIGTTCKILSEPIVAYCFPRLKKKSIRLKHIGFSSASECLGFLISFFVAVWWVQYHRQNYYAWIVQDAFGFCLCVIFICTIRLPNLKVATTLLSAAFCYDIFFVFLTPLVFGSSVMIEVATGGKDPSMKEGYPGVDYCERYPLDGRCTPPEAMPMLLVVPYILDYLKGDSMLGLGDIVIPGLLLSYCLRYEVHNRIKRELDIGLFNRHGVLFGGGYFTISVVGYATGLMLANLAVHILNMGQPALLYLVPCCLGPVYWKSKKTGEFDILWSGFDAEDGTLPTSPTENDSTTLLRK